MSKTIPGLVFDVLENVWERICEIKDCDFPEFAIKMRKIIILLAIVTLVTAIVFTIGFFGHWKNWMFFSNVGLVAMIMLAAWVPNVLISLFTGIAKGTADLIGNEKANKAAGMADDLGNEVRKLVKPLVMIAAVMAFINAYIQLNGFACQQERIFQILVSVVMALAILGTFIKKPRWLEILPITIMIVSIFSSLTFWYAEKSDDPFACVLNNTIQKISLPTQAGNAKYYGVTKNSPELYTATLKEGTITEMTPETSTTLTQGKVVQILDRKAKRFDNDLFVKIRLLNTKGTSYTGGKVCWTQIENLEIAQMTVKPGKYALVKKSSKILFWGNDSWNIYFLTETINVSLVPREMMFSFSGIKTGDLYINPVNMPGVDTLVPAAINCELFNTAYANMTLKAPAGTMVVLSTREATAKEKAVCTDWYLRKQASLQNPAPETDSTATN